MSRFVMPQLTRSCRKHIREEKARIRRIPDAVLRGQKLAELYAKFGVKLPAGYAG